MCIQEIVYQKTLISKLCILPMRIFFLPINLKKNYVKQLKFRQIVKVKQFRIEDFRNASQMAVEKLQAVKDQNCWLPLLETVNIGYQN